MATKHTFPQNGDYDDAENFAQLIGQSNLMDFVGRGLTFTVDYTVPEVTIAEGVAYIGSSSVTASQTSEERLDVGYVVQLPQTTVSLSANATNLIYLEPSLDTDDSATVNAYTSATSASADAIKIGEIDTTNDIATELNRRARIDVESIGFGESDTDTYDLAYDQGAGRITLSSTDVDGAGTDGDLLWVDNGSQSVHIGEDLVAAGGEVIWDESAGEVPTARLGDTSLTVNAGDGLKGGGSVSLGGSTTINLEPADIAGTFLSDDGTDNLTVDIGAGIENDGTGNIRLDEDHGATWTSAHTFSAGLTSSSAVTVNIGSPTHTIDDGISLTGSGTTAVSGSGFKVDWDTDWAFVGLVDRGADSKDVVIANEQSSDNFDFMSGGETRARITGTGDMTIEGTYTEGQAL